MFQSAPHFSSEANRSSTTTRRRAMTFQSAPHFSSEANIIIPDNDPQATVSIRASLQQRGERFAKRRVKPNISVSIRASLQQRGERAELLQAGLRAGQIESFNPRLTSAARRTASIEGERAIRLFQ